MPMPTPIPSRTSSLPPRYRYYKTRLCDKFPRGFCPYGINCTFAHGFEELRHPEANLQELQEKQTLPTRPDYTAVAVEHKKSDKICFEYFWGRECKFGERCLYLHQRPEQLKENQSVGATGEMKVAEPVPAVARFNPELYKSNGGNGATNIQQLIREHDEDEDMNDVVDEVAPRRKQDPQPTSYFGWKNPVKTELYKSNGGNGASNIHQLVREPHEDEEMYGVVAETAPRWKKDPQPTSYFGWKNPVKIGRIYGDWPDAV